MSCSMTAAEWDSADVLQLIELYEKHPVLWNMKHGGHNNKLLKQRAWEVIGGHVGVHPADARRKMDSLLSSFRRERCRLKKMAEEGKVDKGKRWFAYNSLLFLLDKYDPPENEVDDSTLRLIVPPKPPSKPDDLTVIHLEAADHPSTTTPEKNIRGTKRRVSTTEEDDPTKETQQYTESPMNQTSSNRNVVSSSVVPIFSTPLLSAPQPRDECATYGEHVGNKLRGYSKRTQAIVQFHINNILFQADINGFESTTELAIDSSSAVLLARSLGTKGEASTSEQ